jgi:Ca2+-binding RTX toxin-like protein
VLGANHLVNTEMLVLLSGGDTRFGDTAGNLYSYNLKTVDANVGAGERLLVSFNTLGAGENVTFDGSAETNGKFLTFAGLGNDTIIGGAQDDGFYFGNGGRWGAGDSVTGGGGEDQFGLQGNYSGASAIAFGAAQITGVEMLVLLTGGDARFGSPPGVGYSYDVTMDDGNVAAGAMFYVSANTLRANVPGVTDETLTFDGSAELNGHFTIYSGAAADTITGGLLADTIYGGGGADLLTGGGGNDTFAYMNAAHSTAAAKDQILDFATGDLIGLSAIDAVTGGANNAFAYIGSAVFSSTAGELRAFDAGGGVWQVEGDIDGNGIADLVIAVNTGVPLAITDFVL